MSWRARHTAPGSRNISRIEDWYIIRVLHIVSSVNINSGVMSVLMNYYRHMDRSEIQFDFVYYTENNTPNYKNEIASGGGRCFLVAPPNHDPVGFERDIHRLYKEHYGD